MTAATAYVQRHLLTRGRGAMEQRTEKDRDTAGTRPLSGAGRGGHPLRLVIAGGGTGGHLFPAIAIADAFRAANPDSRVCFVSTGNRFEQSALARAGYRLETVAVEGMRGRGMARQLRAGWKVPLALLRSMRILHGFQPDLVVGVGSYAAGPVALGAWLLGTPVVLHEQNLRPGVTNRMLAPLASRIYVSFAGSARWFPPKKTRVFGNPVRWEILAAGDADRPKGTSESGGPLPFTVLIAGGSQGAHGINLAMADAARQIRRKGDFRFVHQTGEKDAERVARAYERAGLNATVRPFFDDMGTRYRMADLVICRAGATTVAEVTALGKGVIFIPYPHAADNHQEFNARSLSDAGAAETMLEKDLDGRRLALAIEGYAAHRPALAAMGSRALGFGRPSAARDIVDDCRRMLAAR